MTKYIQHPLSKSNINLFVSFVVLDEIEERRQFLEDMASLGQVKQYIKIINTEISQVNKQCFTQPDPKKSWDTE